MDAALERRSSSLNGVTYLTVAASKCREVVPTKGRRNIISLVFNPRLSLKMQRQNLLRPASSAMSLVATVILASCGEGNQRPIAYPGSFEVDEDATFSGYVQGADAESVDLRFLLFKSPQHGHVEIDEVSGAFSYSPARDYYGTDSFQFRAWDGANYSSPAMVEIAVRPINDPPVATTVALQRNSPYTLEVVVPIPMSDVDGDILQVDATSSDTRIAQVAVEPEGIVITPIDYGSVTINITGSDGEYTAQTQFGFIVGDVVRDAVVAIDGSSPRIIALRNEADRDATFKLTFNGHHAFASAAEAAEHVWKMAPLFGEESFARKLWRFVRDNTYHNVPLNADRMWYDMWTTMNSLGWGFCGHVAAVYVEIARAAGFEARVWGLTGHVVPEIRVDGRWEMYDPDMAVYYLNSEGKVAGVEELAEVPSLITNPINPVLVDDAQQQSGPYHMVIAEYYASQADNYTNDTTFNVAEPGGGTLITMPAGSALLFPGKWTSNPVGYDGDIPYVVPEYRQALLHLPAGWVGSLRMPWVLWDVAGGGEVRIAGENRAAGDASLSAYLKSPGRPVTTLEVVANSDGLDLIFLINAMWYDILPGNEVSLLGKDVWAIAIEDQLVPDSVAASLSFPDHLRKPVDAP